MHAAPIELIFYDEKDQPVETHSRSRIPSYLLDSAINLQIELSKAVDGKSNNDALFDFVVEFYGNKFTREELKQKTDLMECMAVLQSIIVRTSQMAKEFAQANPPVPSPKKK
jgi:hypothetical protein